MILLRELCSGLDTPAPGAKGGRPRTPIGDSVFAAVYKVFSLFSGRRFNADLQDAVEKGYLPKKPHYNSIGNFLGRPETTTILLKLIEISGAPLTGVETNFAVDGTGISTTVYRRWMDEKEMIGLQEKDWLRLHLICGVRTNIVTGVVVTGYRPNESPFLPQLVTTTAKRFRIGEVSADKQYASVENLTVIDEVGGMPYIPMKIDATGASGGIWRRMFHFYQSRRDEFLEHYHQRSNVEATFWMIKSKFGSWVRSKTPTAMKNEVLCKILCHNICCIIHSYYELGIAVEFWPEKKHG